MRIAFGCDHGGWPLRDTILHCLREERHEVLDLGPRNPDSSDHPDYAAAVARAVASGDADLGVLTCGTGIGMAIAANKIQGVYAANVADPYSATMAREHNGANVIALGGRTLGPELAREVLEAFLAAGVNERERYRRRRGKIEALDSRQTK